MPAPVLQRDWTIVPNQRIPIASYATLVTQGGRYLRLIADTLLANGYTCKGSCDSTTGAMDGVNRWSSDANASHQAANTTSAVSWMVLTDGNGCNIVLSFVGATGDIARISFSPTGVTAVAGTSTFTPTSSDEIVLFTGVSLITNSTTQDRVLYVWVDSEAKSMRTCCFSSNAVTNGTWGVELVNANRTTMTFSPAVWGFAFIAANLALTSSLFFAAYVVNQNGGQARINGTTTSLGCGAEMFASANAQVFAGNVKPELQQASGICMFPVMIGSTTATRQGPCASLYDVWTGKFANLTGGCIVDVIYPGGQWIQICGSSNGSIVWPWDGTTIPQAA